MDVSVAFTDKQMLMATHHGFAFLSDNNNGNGKESKKVRIILCLVPHLSFTSPSPAGDGVTQRFNLTLRSFWQCDASRNLEGFL